MEPLRFSGIRYHAYADGVPLMHRFELTNDASGNDADTFASLSFLGSKAVLVENGNPWLHPPHANALQWVKSLFGGNRTSVLSAQQCGLLQSLAKRSAEQNSNFDKGQFQERLLGNIEGNLFSKNSAEQIAILVFALRQYLMAPSAETSHQVLNKAAQFTPDQKALSNGSNKGVFDQLKVEVPIEPLIDSLVKGMQLVE
jgi:hypothetical protein